MVHTRPEEWYFELADEGAVAVCRLRFTGDPDNRPSRKITPEDEVPKDVVEAVLEYDGNYGPVSTVQNPVKPTPDETTSSENEV